MSLIIVTPFFFPNAVATEKYIKRERKVINKIRVIRPWTEALGI